MKAFFSLLALLCIVFAQATPLAPEMASIKLATAINLAGKQRMLAQRMAKSYMLKGMGEDMVAAQRQMDISISSFEENLRLLKAFPSSSSCQTALAREEALWGSYKAQLTGEVKKQDIAAVLASSDAMLATCEEVVASLRQMATTSASTPTSATEQSLAAMIDVAGRQRMYSQRLVMYYAAYILDPAHPDAYFAEVKKLHTKVEDGMVMLYTCTCNTQALMDELSIAVGMWKPVRDDLNGLQQQMISVSSVADAMTILLQQMDTVTKMYEDQFAL